MRQKLLHRFRCACHRSRAHRLVRFLGVLGLGLVGDGGRRQECLVEVGTHILADVGDGFLRQVDRVGPHVGDETDRAFAEVDPFVQLLSSAHHAVGGHAELAHPGLLQCRRRERCAGMTRTALLLDAHDAGVAAFEHRQPFLAARFVLDRELLELFALEVGELGGERLSTFMRVEVQRPVFARNEGFDFFLALDDHAQGRRLHAAGTQPRTDLAPQQRRQVEADQVVQCAPGLLRVDQVGGNFARVAHRILDGRFGYLVEGHPLHRRLDLALFEDFADVPGNRLAFPIRVGGQQHFVGLLGGLDDGFDVLGIALDDLVLHREALGVDRTGLRLQVAHVTVAGENFVVGAQVFLQRLGFRRRFDNDEFGHD